VTITTGLKVPFISPGIAQLVGEKPVAVKVAGGKRVAISSTETKPEPDKHHPNHYAVPCMPI
jgi:hypothetical protein